MSDIAKLNSRTYPSNIPYCKCCGGNGYEGSDCESLRAELKEARAVIRNTAKTVQAFREQAEKARADWHAAENELWLGELREKIEKLREQRDRAMKAAHGLRDGHDGEWIKSVDIFYELAVEISKEKETE